MVTPRCALTREPEFDDPELVGRLIDTELTGERLWGEDELREVLEHQLSGPLVVDLQMLGNVVALEAAQLCLSAAPPIVSYRDLFEHPEPPVKLLQWVKWFAQRQLVAPEAELPARIARLLYFTVIAAARMSRGMLSQLPDAELMAGIGWFVRQAWVDDRTRRMLERALDEIHKRVRNAGSDDVDA